MDEETILSTQLNKAEQESSLTQAVERVLSVCQWDYFGILDVEPKTVISDSESMSSDVRKRFRKTSLRLHPDRNHHPQAPKAFSRLKKAELVINSTDDEAIAERTRLVDIYKSIVDNLGLTSVADIRARVASILEELIHQQEADKRNRQLQEASRMEEQTRHRKIREHNRQRERQWEDDRDDRVANWRSFVGKVDKKKTNKTKIKKLKKLA